jgi:hypothetical protein
LLPYATPKPLTTYLRKDFAVPIPAAQIGTLTLKANYNDGFVAYLNGTEVARRSLGAGDVSFGTAAGAHPAGGFETIDLSAHKSLLQPGKNTLAVELHLSATSDSDGWWDAELTCTLASVPTDTDGDGMPDAWEVAHSLDPANPADASGDLDADGQRNGDEYLSGTNPNDAGSVFRIESIERFSGGCRVTLPTVSGKVYRLEYSPDLIEWFPAAADVVATGPSLQIVDAAAVGESRRFYRARIPAGL